MALVIVKCQNCGASARISSSRDDEVCAYCNSALMADPSKIPPKPAPAPAPVPAPPPAPERKRPTYIPPRPKVNVMTALILFICCPIAIYYITNITRKQERWDEKYGGYYTN